MKLTIAFLICFCGFGQDKPATTKPDITFTTSPNQIYTTLTVTSAPMYLILSGNGGKETLRIDIKTGEVTLGKGITPNDAAKQLWKELQRMAGNAGCPDKPSIKQDAITQVGISRKNAK